MNRSFATRIAFASTLDSMMDKSQDTPIDPITLEVVIEALLGIVREMRVTVIRWN